MTKTDYEQQAADQALAKLGGFFAGVAVGVFGAMIGANAFYADRVVPKETAVQQGYVAPSDLEVKLDDLDHNGKHETLVLVKGEPYLLKYDKDGKPQLFAYEVRPASIVTGD